MVAQNKMGMCGANNGIWFVYGIDRSVKFEIYFYKPVFLLTCAKSYELLSNVSAMFLSNNIIQTKEFIEQSY